MASINGQLPIILLLICTIIISSTSYFTYSDCKRQCRDKKLPCIMLKTIGGYFTTMCMEEHACEEQADEDCPCISGDKPTLGGFDLWRLYKQTNPTTTTPKPITTPRPTSGPTIRDNCRRWKITSAVQGLVSTLLISGMMFRRIAKWYRDRRLYQRLQAPMTDDNPYRSTVENIDSVDEAPNASTEQIHETIQE